MVRIENTKREKNFLLRMSGQLDDDENFDEYGTKLMSKRGKKG